MRTFDLASQSVSFLCLIPHNLKLNRNGSNFLVKVLLIELVGFCLIPIILSS